MMTLRAGNKHPAFVDNKTAGEIGKPFGLSGGRVAKFITKYMRNIGYRGKRPNIAGEEVMTQREKTMGLDNAAASMSIGGVPTFVVPEIDGIAVLTTVGSGQGFWINQWGKEATSAISSLIQEWMASGSPTKKKSKAVVKNKPPKVDQVKKTGTTIEEMEEMKFYLNDAITRTKQLVDEAEGHRVEENSSTAAAHFHTTEAAKYKALKEEKLRSVAESRKREEDIRLAINQAKAEAATKTSPYHQALQILEAFVLHQYTSRPDTDISFNDVYKAVVACRIEIPRRKKSPGVEGWQRKAVNDLINKSLLEKHPNLTSTKMGMTRWNSAVPTQSTPTTQIPLLTVVPIEADPEKTGAITVDECRAVISGIIKTIHEVGPMLFKNLEGGAFTQGKSVDDIFWDALRQMNKESDENNTELRESLDDLYRNREIKLFSRTTPINSNESVEFLYASNDSDTPQGWKMAMIAPRKTKVVIRRRQAPA